MPEFVINVGAKALKLDLAACQAIISQPSSGEAGEQLAILLGLCKALAASMRLAEECLQDGNAENAAAVLKTAADIGKDFQ